MIFGKRYRELKEKIAELKDATKDVLKKEEIVECETCGCLVYAGKARNGKSEVRQSMGTFWSIMFHDGGEYIYTPKYCRRCYPLKDTIKIGNHPKLASKAKKAGKK